MPRIEIDLSPVDHITTDALGPKGKRVFYIQGTKGDQIVTLIAEKFQIQALAVGIEQFLVEIAERFPELSEASPEYKESNMRIMPPVDPLFRLADIGLGYSVEDDLAILVIHELMPDNLEDFEDDATDEAGVVRFLCTRDQLRALGHWGLASAERGRATCPQCGLLEEPEGHFCVKKNGGHKRD